MSSKVLSDEGVLDKAKTLMTLNFQKRTRHEIKVTQLVFHFLIDVLVSPTSMEFDVFSFISSATLKLNKIPRYFIKVNSLSLLLRLYETELFL